VGFGSRIECIEQELVVMYQVLVIQWLTTCHEVEVNVFGTFILECRVEELTSVVIEYRFNLGDHFRDSGVTHFVLTRSGQVAHSTGLITPGLT